MVTGGEDKRVNLFAVGKPTAILSMAGHQSAVECVTFDANEEVVVAGAAGGTLKLWDLEQAKAVRTLVGHRSNCQSVDFHPFGEFFASGSLDTNLKVWDVRRKGCIHTYKGHDRGVGVCKFSPDGKWVVSGGQDGRARLWDLTAGRCLKEFAPHDGAVTSVEFHPNELLLATGSADRAVKLWDLETFELVDECVEATGIKSLRFSPDGSTLLAGTAEFLKTWRWEPARSHDAVDVSWKNLKDLSVHDNKLLGANISNSFVGVWVVDLTRVEPFHSGADRGPGGGGTRDAEREERSRRGPEETAAAAVAAAAEVSRARLEREERQRRVLMEANGVRTNSCAQTVSARPDSANSPFDPRRVARDEGERENAHRTPMAMNPRFAAAHGIAEDPIADASIADPLDRVRNDRPSSSLVVVPAKRPSTRPNAEEHPAETVPASREPAAGTDATRVEPNAYRDEDEDIPEDLPDDLPDARATNGQKADMSDGEDDSRLDTRLDAFPPSGNASPRVESDGEDDGNAFERSDAPAESASPTKAKKEIRADASIRASRPSPRKSFAADAFDLETLRSAALEAETEFVDARAYAPGPEAPPETLAAAMARARAERALDATSRVSGVSSNERTDRMNDGPSRDDSSRDDSSRDIPTTAAVVSTPPVASRRVASTPASATIGRSPPSRSPSSRSPLGVDLASFVPGAGFARVGTPPTPAPDESHVLASLGGADGETCVAIFGTRLATLRAVSRCWTKGDVRGAAEALAAADDLSATRDVLAAALEAPHGGIAGDGAVTLELASALVPLATPLLRSPHAPYADVALRFSRRVAHAFEPALAGAKAHAAERERSGGRRRGIGVDLAGEERVARATATRGALLGQVDALESLAVAAEGDMALRARELLGALERFA